METQLESNKSLHKSKRANRTTLFVEELYMNDEVLFLFYLNQFPFWNMNQFDLNEFSNDLLTMLCHVFLFSQVKQSFWFSRFVVSKFYFTLHILNPRFSFPWVFRGDSSDAKSNLFVLVWRLQFFSSESLSISSHKHFILMNWLFGRFLWFFV